MPKNYDQYRDFRELENKDLQKEDFEQMQIGMGNRKFLNQVWWKDLIIGCIGIAVLIYSNRLFMNTYEIEGYPYKMLLAILQPLGLVVGIRAFVAFSKIIKHFKQR